MSSKSTSNININPERSCPRVNGSCPHKHIGCETMCNCLNEVNDSCLDQEHMENQDITTSFKPKDVLGLMPVSAHERKVSDQEDSLDDALHYLKLNQAMRITEGLTSRSTLSVQLPTGFKDIQKAFYKVNQEEQFTLQGINYVYQGHSNCEDQSPESPITQQQNQDLLAIKSEFLDNIAPALKCDSTLTVFDEAKNNSAEFIAPSLHKLQEDQNLKENLLNLEHSIHVLMNIIGCGVYIQSIGPNHERRLLWANKGLFELMGYEPEYIMSLSGEDFAQKFLHPNDVDKFFTTFKAENDSDQCVSIVYRVKQGKTGQYIWCSVKSAYLGRNGDHSLYMCMLNDITCERRLKDRMARWIRKNELLFEACQEMIFEYDQNTDHVKRFGNYLQFVPSGKSYHDNYLDYLAKQDFIHPEDKELFISIFTDRSIADGKSRRTIKFRMRPCGTNEYLWHVASIIGYTEETTGHVMIIGKINSIHHYESQIAKLNKENQLDPMTKLFNKTTMENIVKQTILENPESNNAILMIDIDNFKKVNDTHGHAFGDEVIMMISRCLKNAFRSSDSVGRMGGDEFMVMLKDVSRDQAISLANIYQKVIQEESAKLSRPYPITSSVGIAFFPECGSTYEEVYHNADMALYEVKQHHKGQVACFKDNKATLVSDMPTVLHNTEQRIATLARKVEQQTHEIQEQERLALEQMEQELLK